MPALQTLVLTDRKATPVNHTFVPKDIDRNGVARVTESTGVPIGDNDMSIAITRTAGNRRKIAIQGRFPIVATETINGVQLPKVIRTSNVNLVFYFDETSTEAERNDVVGMMVSALAANKPLINDTLVKLEGVY